MLIGQGRAPSREPAPKQFLEVCDVATELGIEDADVQRLIAQGRLSATRVETVFRGRPLVTWKVKIDDLQALATGTVNDLQIPFGANPEKLFKFDSTIEAKVKTAFRQAASRATSDAQILGEMKRIKQPSQSPKDVKTIALDFFSAPMGFTEALFAPIPNEFMIKSDPNTTLLGPYLRSRIRRAMKAFLREKYGVASNPVANLYQCPEAYSEALNEAANTVSLEYVTTDEIRILEQETGRRDNGTTVEVELTKYKVTVNYSIKVSVFVGLGQISRVAGLIF